ncbi:MAG TPA: hypothetical protein VNM34_12030 [Verrucomicrobiae bacterium]|nr:hypothetical protein [Verrucomicrobiae bacterium]
MLSVTTRLIAGIVALLMLLAGIGLIALGPVAGVSGLWLTVAGAVLLIALAIERNRYRSEASEQGMEPVGPGGGEPGGQLEPRFQATEETFVDPTSGHRMRVYLDQRSGERRYVAEG